MKYPRILSVAALVGVLALGVAACGKPAAKSASASPASPAASPSPTASAAPAQTPATSPAPVANPRAPICAKVEETGMKLWGPLMEVGTAGNDNVKYKMAVENLLKTTDTVATELTKISSETNDAQLKSAIDTMVMDVQKLKQAVKQYAPDPKKLESVLNSGNFNTGSNMLEPLCAG